jgi:hypothetical protein
MLTTTMMLLVVLPLAGRTEIIAQAGALERELQAAWPAIERKLAAIAHNQQLAEEAANAGRLVAAKRYADDVARLLPELESNMQPFRSATPPEGLSPNLAAMLERAHQAAVTGESARLRAESAVAISAAADHFRRDPDVPGEVDVDEFAKDFLCLHLKRLIDGDGMPSEQDYADFLFSWNLERIIPVTKLVNKARDVIDFAEENREPQSADEAQARTLLFRECTLR